MFSFRPLSSKRHLVAEFRYTEKRYAPFHGGRRAVLRSFGSGPPSQKAPVCPVTPQATGSRKIGSRDAGRCVGEARKNEGPRLPAIRSLVHADSRRQQ